MIHEPVRASSGFHHSSRALAPGEKLPVPPTLFEQIMACRNGMTGAANDDSIEEDFVEADLEIDDPED